MTEQEKSRREYTRNIMAQVREGLELTPAMMAESMGVSEQELLDWEFYNTPLSRESFDRDWQRMNEMNRDCEKWTSLPIPSRRRRSKGNGDRTRTRRTGGFGGREANLWRLMI